MKSLAKLNEALPEYITKEELNSAIRNIDDTLLDMPLRNSIAPLRGAGTVVFDRATTATYIDRYGILQYAAIDEPRFEAKGLLMEGESTNLCLYSNSDYLAQWSIIEGTVDSETITAPDGTATAARFTGSGLATSVFGDTYGTISGKTNIDVYMSFWAKSDTETSATGGFYYTAGTGGTVWGGTISYDLTPEWKRYGYQITLGAHTDQPNIYPQPLRMSGWTGTIDFWGVQVEELSFASSYIPTTTAVATRANEYLYIDYKDNMPKENEDIAMYCQYDISDSPALGGDSRLMVRPRSNAYRGIRLRNGIDDIAVEYGAAVKWYWVYGAGTQGSAYWHADVSQDTIDIFINGEKTATESGLNNVNVGSGFLDIGGYVGNLQLFGHIKNVKVYDKILTDIEVALLG